MFRGDSIKLNGAGATSYIWSGGVTNGISFLPTVTLTYNVTGTINGCSDTSKILIVVNNLPNITINGTSTFICAGDSVTLTGNGASTYTWTNGVIDGVKFSPSVSQSYVLMGTDLNGCTNTSAPINITVQSLPTITASATVDTLCLGGSTKINACCASTYSCTGGVILGASNFPTSTQTYTITGTLNGCSATDTITIVVNLTPTVTAGPISSTVCAGILITLSGGGANTYAWSGGITNATPFAANTSQTYTVIGTDLNNCTDSTTATVNAVTPVMPQLCMITVDSLSLNNVIIWEKSLYTNADTFFVYRDTANNAYGLIGKVPYDSLSMFSDTVRTLYAANGDPLASSWRYKLAIKDTCGNIGAMSPYHQSIFIQNSSGNFSWRL